VLFAASFSLSPFFFAGSGGVALFVGEGLGVAFATTVFLGVGLGVDFGESFGTGVRDGFGSGVAMGLGGGVGDGSWRSLFACVGIGGSSSSGGGERGVSVSGGDVVSIAFSVFAGKLSEATSVPPPLIQTMLCKFAGRVSRLQRTSAIKIAI
jgi:hypothetical protein